MSRKTELTITTANTSSPLDSVVVRVCSACSNSTASGSCWTSTASASDSTDGASVCESFGTNVDEDKCLVHD
ncbi:hypothetical protein Hanom_Chr07g00609311 [Helianthus anomalus]